MKSPRTCASIVSVLALGACSADGPPPSATSPVTPAVTATSALAPVASACAEAPDAGAPGVELDIPERHSVEKPRNAGDACEVAESNLARAAAAILAAPRKRAGEVASRAWDRRAAPARIDEVTRRFALAGEERALLEKNGFVVPARLAFPSYTAAFHEVYQSEMPLWVSVDAVMHAVFRGSDAVVADLEARRLAPLLGRTLAAMHCALPGAAAGYPEETARDLDVYLTAARSLLADAAVPAVFAGDAAPAAALVARAKEAKEMAMIELFGRERRVDFTLFGPRGHYAEEQRGLAPYFRAAMWLSRLEWNLVSRSSRSSSATDLADPRETPREAVGALALADLAAQAKAMDGVRAIERTFATFAGKREDVSLAELAELRAQAGIGSLREPRVFERLKEAIGQRFQRTTRLHYMPQGTTTLPAISTMLGPRVVADTEATAPLVEPRTAARHVIGAADVGYALGHDRARAHLRGEIDRWPTLPTALDEARALAHAPHRGEDLYGFWLRGILALGDRPAGSVPSFMTSEAFADLRLASAIAAYGQIRHNNVLFAGEGYDQGGCVIPDAYLEPAPTVYEALAVYAERGAAAIEAIDARDEARAGAYFQRLARTLRVLAAISHEELSGAPLGDDARRFLSMVVEMRPGSSAGPPSYTGFYFDMFPSTFEALARADFIASFFTSGYEGVITYAGASAPRLGVFVVDAGGAPRVMVGPVARAYEHKGPLARRLDDEAASKLERVSEPWAASYTAPAPREPEITVFLDGEASPPRAEIEAAAPVRAVTVELLDHHRRVIQSITRAVPAGKTRLRFKALRADRPAEALHVAAGGAHAWRETSWQGTRIELGKKRE